jgi:hypothetical protein
MEEYLQRLEQDGIKVPDEMRARHVTVQDRANRVINFSDAVRSHYSQRGEGVPFYVTMPPHAFRDALRHLKMMSRSTLHHEPPTISNELGEFITDSLNVSVQPLLPTAIPELGDKIRLATIHSVKEVWPARRLTQLTLGTLKRNVWTHNAVTGGYDGDRDIHRMSADESARVYSADLSAATDHIPHHVAQAFANLLIKRRFSGSQQAKWLGVVPRMFGPHDVLTSRPKGSLAEAQIGAERTTRGIHMGLGPTWVILCLINIACALYATEHRKSFAVCGDDLIALWTPEEVARYEEAMEGLGLVINRSKAFFEQRGVFCELLVEREGTTALRLTDVGHIAEDSMALNKSGRSKHTLATMDGLAPEAARSKWSRALRETVQKTYRVSHLPGPIRLGGNGRGLMNPRMILPALTEGKISLIRRTRVETGMETAEQNALTDLREYACLQHERDPDVAYTTWESARENVMREARLRDLFEGIKPKKESPTRIATFRKAAGGRLKKSPKAQGAEYFRAVKTALKAAQWPRVDRLKFLNVIHRPVVRGKQWKEKDLNKVQRFLLSCQPQLYVEVQHLEDVLGDVALPGRGIPDCAKSGTASANAPADGAAW